MSSFVDRHETKKGYRKSHLLIVVSIPAAGREMFSVIVRRGRRMVPHFFPVCQVQRFSISIDSVWSKLKFLPMPQLSPTMHTGTIEQWHMQPGDVAEQYRLCVEVSATTLLKESESTEKIHMEVEIMEDMHLAALLHQPGATVDVGTPVAVFCDDEETAKSLQSIHVSESTCYNIIEGIAVQSALC